MPNAAAAARPARPPACGGLVVHPQNTFSIVTKRAPRTYCARFARAQCRRRAAAKQNNENSGRRSSCILPPYLVICWRLSCGNNR